ncbi:MAG: YajQ family cyclic di-GMP-binding protein [Chloroflexi bacterium]|nr:YajQ family cyclic di-GMP-binding protein [Chloroflexota bacterium]MQG00236.1 YajQ family cyclic di-GMP-binding protein [SAR202 cluster bacterium]
MNMPSFDVVCRTDLMEVDNVINGVNREINQRYDLSGTKCEVQRTDNALTVNADDSMKLQQLEELIRKYMVRRNIEQNAFDFGAPESASGDSLRQLVSIKQGIKADVGKKITKAIKGSKIKVQVSINGDELRVSGKNRDDLQNTIAFIKDMNIEEPLQYINFRD